MHLLLIRLHHAAPTVDALVADSTTPTITGTATLGEGETLTVSCQWCHL